MPQMSDCQFGQPSICQEGGKLYALVLNDEWNVFTTHEEDHQVFFVCALEGDGTDRGTKDATLLAETTTPIMLFHSYEVKEKSTKIHCVGHYKVSNFEELEIVGFYDLVNFIILSSTTLLFLCLLRLGFHD